MENSKEDNKRANPKINDNSDLMNSIIEAAIYHIERGETDFYLWAKKMVKEIGDESIRPYLHKAWREANHKIHKRPTNKERNKEGKKIYYAVSLRMFKYYGKKVIFIFLGIFIWLSVFNGMIELLYKILPYVLINVFEHWGRKELDTERNMIYIIAGVFSSICFYSMYMGYKYYQKGYWGDRFLILGRHVLMTFDRDELIYKLEKKLNLLDKLNELSENSEYDEEDLEDIQHQLSEVIKLKETKECSP